MTNLLPLKRQKAVWAMYRARFLIAASIVLLVFAAIAALALIPSYLALELAAPPAPQTTSQPKGSPGDTAAIARAQAIVRAAVPLVIAATSSSRVIDEALSLKPAGVSITHVTLASGAPGQLALAGTATRDALNAYRNALSADPFFTGVSVPVNALVGSDNGQFSITLSGNF